MLSSSRSKAKGFSLRCCGSERCLRRVLGTAVPSCSPGTSIDTLSGAGRCPSACGTGVQGCQEDVEGPLPGALRSSTDGRGWDGAEETPGRAMDLTKDISCKDRAE